MWYAKKTFFPQSSAFTPKKIPHFKIHLSSLSFQVVQLTFCFFFLFLATAFSFCFCCSLHSTTTMPSAGAGFSFFVTLGFCVHRGIWRCGHTLSDGNFSLKVDGIFPVSYTHSAFAHIGKKAIFYSSSLSKSVYFSACTFIIAILLPLFLRRKENEKHAREKATPIFLFFSFPCATVDSCSC